MDMFWVDKLIAELQLAGCYANHTIREDFVNICLSTDLTLLVYFPNSERTNSNFSLKTIHLDIDILKNSFSKVIYRIKGLMGKGPRIFARNTVVARIDKQVALDFISEYHLNDPLAGKYRYGLYYGGELVSVAIFSGGRIMHYINNQYRSFELLRFCHKADYTVVGGVSKLIKAFVADFQPHDIMTYADKDWSQESSLQKIGFVEEGSTVPQQFFIKEGTRLTHLDTKEEYNYIVTNRGSFKMKLYL